MTLLTPIHMKFFIKYKVYLPSSRINILTLALRVDKVNANYINKKFTESNSDDIFHENIKKPNIDRYAPDINRNGSSILAEILISGICNL